MPLRPPTGPLQLLSAPGLVSTVRPSGTRGIWERTRLGRPFLYVALRARVSSWPPLRLARLRFERESVGVVRPPGSHPVNRMVEVKDGPEMYRTGCAQRVRAGRGVGERPGPPGRAGRDLTGEALRVFADSLGPEDEVAIEATCNTHAIVRLIEPHVARVVVSNPMKTRAIAEAKVKTDKVDAAVLAELLAADYLPSVWVADEDTQALRRQVARRANIVRQRTRLKNQVQAILQRNLVARCPFGGPVRGQGPLLALRSAPARR